MSSWRDFVWLMVAFVGTLAVLEAITRIFAFAEDQRQWFDLAATCVVVLLFVAWSRWRGE
jgi:hypothetical protein